MQSQKQSVGFIGTGVMGSSMAGHLINTGYSVHIYNRTKERAVALIEKGAIWHDSPAAVAKESQAIITIVGFPVDVEQTYFGDNGVFSAVQKGSCLVDMTTSTPLLAKKIYAEAKKHGCGALDAPVSGGDKGAREAILSIMVGGDRVDFEKMAPLFEVMGKTVVYQGESGCGQHAKMANQIAIAAGMVAISEAMAYAKAAGLDPSTVLSSIGGGAAGSWSLNNLWPRIIAGNFEPGFYVKHFIKDMKIAIESAEEMGLDLPGLKLAKSLYDKLAAQGGENYGTQALYKLFER